MAPASPRNRPHGETSGSAQRPGRRLTGPTLDFDLVAELASLREEAAWLQGDRNARTLVEEPGLRVVLTALKAGTRIREHRTAGRVSIQAIAGHLRVQVTEQAVNLPAGHLLVLAPSLPHDVEAIEEGAFLLTIASTVAASQPRNAKRATEAQASDASVVGAPLSPRRAAESR